MDSSSASPLKLSIVVRCRGVANGLAQLFEVLRAQTCDCGWELIVVAETTAVAVQALCHQASARLGCLPPDEFTDGRAHNLGIRDAAGELILLLNADTVPIGSCFLERAMAPFSDPLMAAARCLSVSNVAQLGRWHQPKAIQYRSVAEQQHAERAAHWSDYPASACCVIRRSVWEQVPFDENLEASEDKFWASQVLARGFKIRSCAEALWLANGHAAKREQWETRHREQLGFYQFTGRRPLSWSAFLWQATRSLVEAPLSAIRDAANEIAWNTRLLTIPRHARRAAKVTAPHAPDRLRQ